MRRNPVLSVSIASVLLALMAVAQDLPGPRPDGSILLPNGWSLRPHGKEIPLEADLPIRMAWHPGGRHIAVQHVGFRKHQVVILDTVDERVVATLPLPRSWSGMAWNAAGDRLLVSGGVEDRVHVFSFAPAGGRAEAVGHFPVGDPETIDLPAGMCFDHAGRLFVCLQRTQQLVRLGALGAVDLTVKLPAGALPFECVASHDGHTVWVSLWGRAEVWAIDADSGEKVATIASGQHPSELLLAPDGKRLFVSNGNENTVTVIDVERGVVEESISSALYPLAPPGSTPNSLAIDPKGGLLLVANADNNNCAVIAVSERGHARGMGFIPVGAYPTSVRFSRDGSRVWVANGKGAGGSHANPQGPQPERGHRHSLEDYTGSMFKGSLSVFAMPGPEELGALSEKAYACSPLAATSDVRGGAVRPADSPIPAKVGDPSPIRHVVYIIKENRTYDQVFGDIARGNGDASLCLFPEKVTPNHHRIVDTWVLLDNFYVESEVSADGHEWTMGAYANDFVERTWPVRYGGKGKTTTAKGRKLDLGYPSGAGAQIAVPKSGYLFDLAKARGLPFRSYGEFVSNARTADGEGRARLASMAGSFDPKFRGFDLNYSDLDRAARFLEELAGFAARGEFPRLVVMTLPNDHTAGTSPGQPTPRAYVAENDLALGRVLEGLSRSPFWKSMVVFVVEDDAQNGPDHVDAHRTVALVAGPYVRRGAVVSTLYSTCSMLRTMELILGLPPMTQFDAAALPMYDCFTGTPDLTPYEHLAATWPLEEKNEKTAWGAEESLRFDLSREDAADDLRLNEVIWRSVRGAGSPMPMPRRAAFVRVLQDD